MRVVTLEKRDGGLSQVIARFALDGEELNEPSLRPDIKDLAEIRDALFDYIMAEKKKVEEVLTAQETQSQRDADIVSGVMDIQAKTLAAAEAHAAHVAAMAAKAEEAVAAAQEQMNEAKAKAAKE